MNRLYIYRYSPTVFFFIVITSKFSNTAGVEGAEECEGVGVEEMMNNEQGMMK
jgi:hypothetical protein